MDNIVAALKRFISNKNTITIIGVLAGVVALWWFYNSQVNRAITTISVPYAIEAIDAGGIISSDNISQVSITQTTLKGSEIVTNANELVGKYVCSETSIPANGFFYQSQLCDEEPDPNEAFANIPDGYTLYYLSVNSQTTYANSIMPGDYIDLYLSAVDDDKLIIFGKFIESIEVLAVRDSNGYDVFWNSRAGDSAFLYFAVPDEYHTLLNVAEAINGYSISIIPVPRSASYSNNPGETKIYSETLKNFIMSKAATIID